MSRTLFAVGLIAALLGGCRYSDSAQMSREPVEVIAAADPSSATTGDLVTFTIEVDHDPEYEVEIRSAEMDIPGLALVDFGVGEPHRRGGRVVESRWYRLRADLVGSYELPSHAVEYRRKPTEAGPGEAEIGAAEGLGAVDVETVATASVAFEVESVLPTDAQVEDIRDIKPLQTLDVERPWLPWALAAAIAVLIAVAWLVWRRRSREQAVEPAVPAHVIALAALDRLKQADLSRFSEIRKYYFRLSAVVRAYVEGRYAFNATDLTTEEIVAGLHDLPLASEEEGLLKHFLRDSDRVKFAAHVPDPREIAESFRQALTFVESTKPAEQELQAEA